MGRRILDVTLDDVVRIPPDCLQSCYWELAQDVDGPDARFHKEEWFSMTLLEWGRCGKLAVDGDRSEGFAQYAPPSLFPRLGSFPSAVVSPDAVYLSYCYVIAERRREGLGTHLVQAVARDLVDRRYRALEALGDRDWVGGFILPAPFLGANGFGVVRDDPRFPLMRLDLRATLDPRRERAAAAIPLAAPAPAPGLA
ncbi:MAG TPA: GNAT family N-acetyltransferase [Actinomycetota bacterium]|nr:GNAT family N-acetyltransferase [Actinomycetota bacterium]